VDARLDDITLTDPQDRALLDHVLRNIATRLVDEEGEHRPAALRS
jgi:hypothetical protein